MVRVGGLTYTCTPGASAGRRISDMRLGGRPIEAGKTYKVAGWAPVAEEARNAPGAKPVWEHVETWLKSQRGRVKPRRLNVPRLVGTQGDPGISTA
jgi:sulfur-oxidizing protein SoxB